MKEMRWDEWQSGHRDAPSQTNINISLLSCHCGPGVCVTADNSNYCDQVRPEPGGRCMLVSCLITFYSNIIGWLWLWLLAGCNPLHWAATRQGQPARQQHQAAPPPPPRPACPGWLLIKTDQTDYWTLNKMAPQCRATSLVWFSASSTC